MPLQRPAKRLKPAAAAAAASAGGDDEAADAVVAIKLEGGGGGGGGKLERLAHNAAVKADGAAMQGQRFLFLEEHLQVGGRVGEEGGWMCEGAGGAGGGVGGGSPELLRSSFEEKWAASARIR